MSTYSITDARLKMADEAGNEMTLEGVNGDFVVGVDFGAAEPGTIYTVDNGKLTPIAIPSISAKRAEEMVASISRHQPRDLDRQAALFAAQIERWKPKPQTRRERRQRNRRRGKGITR